MPISTADERTMICAEEFQRPVPKKIEDARALQLRLYREIGISAVAAALAIGAQRREPISESRLADAPVIPRADDLAA